MKSNKLSVAFSRLAVLLKIKGWILAMVAFQALLLVFAVLVLDFYTLISIILGIFIATSPIYLVLLYKHRQRGFKKGKWMEPVLFIALVTIGITFAYTVSHRNPDAVIAPGMLKHFENTGDFNEQKMYVIPADQYYYMDFTNTSPNMPLGTNINIVVNLWINVQPTNVTVQFAENSDHFQLSKNFSIIRNDSYGDSKFDNQSLRINNVWTEVWHMNTSIVVQKIFHWKPVIMWKFAGGIDPGYLALGTITYLYAEMNATARFDNGTVIEPGQTGLSSDSLPLEESVSASFWLVTLVMLAIFVVCLILSLVTSRFKILIIITLVLTCVSIICMMLLIVDELHASWVDWVPWPLSYLKYQLAVVIAVIKWVISMGLVTALIIFVTALFGRMGSLTNAKEE